MAGNSTGLYGTTTSNVTIEPNNNTGLYNTDTTPIPVNNNITVSGNITAGGYISAVGNIVTEGYFVGDGSQLTNLPGGTYGNANVAAYLPTYTGNLNPGNVSSTGNVTGAYILGDGSQLTNLPVQPGTYGNANVAAYLPTYTGNLTPNIVTANLFTGNGSALTSLTGANVTGTVPQANTVTNAAQPNITSVGTLTSLSTSGNVTVGDDLSVVGTIYGTFSGNITGNLVVPGANTEVLYNNSGNAGASSDLTFNSDTVVLSTTGNVVANNFVGNGSYLTGMYGNANVATYLPTYTGNIAAGNVLTNNYLYANGQPFVTSDYGNANVASFLTTYTGDIAGANLSVFGNVTGNYILGDGSQLTNLPIGNYSNANVAAYLPTYTGALAGANLSVSGNVTGAYIFGNGSQLTGLPATYGNSNVVTLLSSFGSNTVSTTGNITAGYLIGDGSQITNLPAGNYSNANVANFLPTYSGVVTASSVSATGNVTGAYVVGNGSLLTNLTGANVTGTVANATYATSAGSATTADSANTAVTVTGNAQANITSVGTLTSLSVTGAITSSADITGANLKTSGSTGNIVGPNYVTANFFVGDGGYLTNVASSFGNANVGAYLTTYTGNIAAGNISATGNITGSYILGNGSQLTGLPATYGNANVDSHLAAFGSNTISTTGNITAGSIKGTTFETTAGLTTSIGATGIITNGDVNAYLGNITGANFIGNGSKLTSLTGANVAGQVANALVAGTVYTAAQPNITSTGTLTSLSVAGNVTTGGILTDGYYYANGTPISFGGTYGNANVNSLLAAWGSNALSTTGNVTASYVVGNGSLLTNLTGANITGTVANATYATSAGSAATATDATHATVADSANAVAGGNVTGQVANALVAGTVYTNAQPNITSVGTLSALSVTGNITTGGILTDGYYYANGAPFSGGGGSTYGDSNVNTLLAAWGSNTLSTTGNVSVGNLNMTGQVFDASGVLQLNAVGNIVLAPTGSAQIFGATDIIGGKLTTGAVTYANTDGTNGQVLTTYGNGVTYFSTVSGGSGSPGGANTQIQFNDNGAFAGNAAMTFNNTTGNIGLGNIVVNTNQIQTVGVANLAAVTSGGQTTPWRILLGNAYNGNTNSAYAGQSPGTVQSPLNAPRLLAADFVTFSNNGMRFAEQTNYVWANLSANIANTGTRISVARNEMVIGGGTSNYTISATNTPSLIVGSGTQVFAGAGTNANLSLVGNLITTAGVTGIFSGVTVNNYSTANIIVGQQTQLTTNNANTTAFGNATTQVGHFINFSGTPANANITGTTTAVGYYMPGATALIPGSQVTNGNIARMATNYYSFRSDDTLAKAQLGSLSSFNEFQYNVTSSSGAVTINKANAQVQYLLLTEAITAMTFSNFVSAALKPNSTIAYQTDTVTLIIRQGATPYAVTMPSGAAYKYAGGISAVGTTANSVTMISITAITDAALTSTEYLITISPEFS